MEALLKTVVPVTDAVMRQLALQRGLVVRDALIAKGLPSDRLFIGAPKPRLAGADNAAWTPSAQLVLRND
jgi:outer membrane protein OmpA-like peptidoglycan-associated protein